MQDSNPNLAYGEHQQLVRSAKTFSGYYEMPMTIATIVVSLSAVVCVLFLTMKKAWTMGFLLKMVVMGLLGELFTSCSSLDMDMRNMISRVAMPQEGAKPRSRSSIDQQ